MRISDWSSDVCSSDLARYDFPLVTYIGVEFSVEVIENDAVGRAKINAGTPTAGITTAFVADADRTLNGGFFASLRNAAEEVIGHDCSAAGDGDAAVVILCGGGRCGKADGKAAKAAKGLTHKIGRASGRERVGQ